ncbi:MAG: hypothetical protein HRU20_18330 [Pseudomonadales bacterium]|nr:hypothetical protein [Pseudomonadales bacterium]
MSEESAFNWIIDVFESNDIPYIICGGLAAIAYGAIRELNDIDIYVPKSCYQNVCKFGEEYITFGPERYDDNFWSVDYVQFVFESQKIEVGSDDNIKIFNSKKKIWEREVLDFSIYSVIELFDRQVRVMRKNDLIDYKNKLDRTVDQADIKQISNA